MFFSNLNYLIYKLCSKTSFIRDILSSGCSLYCSAESSSGHISSKYCTIDDRMSKTLNDEDLLAILKIQMSYLAVPNDYTVDCTLVVPVAAGGKEKTLAM